MVCVICWMLLHINCCSCLLILKIAAFSSIFFYSFFCTIFSRFCWWVVASVGFLSHTRCVCVYIPKQVDNFLISYLTKDRIHECAITRPCIYMFLEYFYAFFIIFVLNFGFLFDEIYRHSWEISELAANWFSCWSIVISLLCISKRCA